MGNLLQDIRFGFRMLVKNPAISIIAILTLGVGIGLTATVFSIVNGAIIRGLPFEDADKIMVVSEFNASENDRRGSIPIHDYEDYRDQQQGFEGLAAFNGGTMNLTAEGERPERYTGAYVTGNLFPILRVQPVLGRTIQAGDTEPGAQPIVVLGYRVWQERYGGARDILGKSVRVNSHPVTVVGVMPEGFGFPSNEDLWMPLTARASSYARGSGPYVTAVGRLSKGVSLDEAASQLAIIAQRIAQDHPDQNAGYTSLVVPYARRFLGDEVYGLLYTMLGAVFGVLLIACANVANLLLARASIRAREVAIRSALGATRARVISQLLAESLAIAAVGGTMGLALGYMGIAWFRTAVAIDPPPFWMKFELDTAVLLFVLGITVVASLIAGIAPALQASRTDINEVLNDEGRGSSSFRMGRFSGALVVAEIALSCGLLVASGLMIKSVTQLKNVDLPFTTENIFTARLNLPEAEYPDTASRVQFYDRFLPTLTTIPGVLAATLSDGLPASGNGSRVFQVEGASYSVDRDFPSAREGIVTPGYFDTFDSRILQGRAFTTQDHRETLPVALVNEGFVRAYFPDGDAIGHRIRMGRNDTTAAWLTLIGVVPDMKMEGFGDRDESPAGFYIPIAQSGVGNFVSMALRTRGDPLAVTSAVQSKLAELDPNLPVYRVMSMKEVIAEETWFYVVFGTLFMAFGFVALFLAAVGLYGVMSFAVSRRRTEMGVRMALGADGRSLIGLVMRKGVMQLAVGLSLGLLIAFLAATPLQIVLYDVSPRDPFVFGTIVTTLALTGLAASFIPARRVTKVDPLIALRSE